MSDASDYILSISLVFLAELLVAIAFLVSEVLLHTTFLTIPYNFIIRKTLPHHDEYVMEEFPPYVSSSLLTVVVITLVLFFASGMYEEKIGYANRYATHLCPESYKLKLLLLRFQICSPRQPRTP